VVALSGSVALLSDTLHNLADALTAVPLWIAFALGRRLPNRRYTYGYGRAEDIAGIFIVATIAFSASIAAYEAVQRLLHPREIESLPLVVLAGVIGFLGNELVAVYRIRVGRRIGSAALVADGLHARTDGFTSLAVVVGAGGVAAGFPAADPIVGLVISAAILVVLWGAARDIYYRLMDAVDHELVDDIEKTLAGVEGVDAIDEVKVRWIGHKLRAEVEVTVDDALGSIEAHDIAVRAHHRLLHEVPRLQAAIVHASPTNAEGTDYHAEVAHHFGSR
jgi:cation diffusion facilitator family transporter